MKLNTKKLFSQTKLTKPSKKSNKKVTICTPSTSAKSNNNNNTEKEKLLSKIKSSKNNKLMHPLTKGRNTKANSKKKDKSNNNSKLTTNSTKNNNVKINVKSMKDSTTDSKNLKINLLFDYGKKSNIKKIESLPTLRDMNKTQRNEKPKVKNLSSIYFIWFIRILH